ncbi:tRNA-specific adenosine deaminase 2 [Lecanicillium sp. MT-2017a]|nr:tRNA-specific adenosine deaminase 2 [Lecanicillium sp. MT-2017a]
MTSTSANNTLPQGFSIYQPALGAQLQFFPAVGSQELDELIHAYLPGAAASSEKRATLALDFFEHTQMTGQTFKFYPVYAVAASPTTSASSSFNVSPINPTWDFSQASRTPSISSHTSSQRVSKPTSPASRPRATDFSALPGMKIMTRDGLDVTNSASRGSKTKEQRDHAHLMRIIKACDSCRKKKIRCDPSHKKRAAVQATPQPASAAKPQTKKARTLPPPQPRSVSPQSISPASISPPVVQEDTVLTGSPFDFDASGFSFDAFDAFAPVADGSNLWDEFVQYPPMDLSDDYDFFTDPQSYFSSQSSERATADACLLSHSRSSAPAERGPDVESGESRTTDSPQLPYLEQSGSGSGSDYADFNLFSPGSTFSEDDRMLQVSSSASTLSSVYDQPLSASASPRDQLESGATLAVGRDQPEERVQLGGLAQLPQSRQDRDRDDRRRIIATTDTEAKSGLGHAVNRSDITMTTNEQGQLVICCPPGTVVVTNSGSNGHGQDATPSTNLRTSAFAAATDLSESAVASVPAAADDVDVAVGTWLNQGYDQRLEQQDLVRGVNRVDSTNVLTEGRDGLDAYMSSRFVHRNTDSVLNTATGALVAESPGSGDVDGTFVASVAPADLASASSHSSPVLSFGSYVSDQAGARHQDLSGLGDQSRVTQAQLQTSAGDVSVAGASRSEVGGLQPFVASLSAGASTTADDSSRVELGGEAVSSKKDVLAIGRTKEQGEGQGEGQQMEPALMATVMQSVITQVLAATAYFASFLAKEVDTRTETPTGKSTKAWTRPKAPCPCRAVGGMPFNTAPLPAPRAVMC